jgi:flagellar biosynthesis/type III secretory pathway chaperone
MQTDMQALYDILQQQKDVLKGMTECAREKEQAIVRNDTAALERLTGQEAALMRELDRLEEARMDLAAGVAAGVGLKADASLAELCGRLDAGDGAVFTELHMELRAAAERQMRQNRINGKLIELQLSQIRLMLETLTSLPPGTYTGQGTVEDSAKQQNVFDLSI